MNVPLRDMMSRHLATVINDLFSFAFETVFSAKHRLTHVQMSFPLESASTTNSNKIRLQDSLREFHLILLIRIANSSFPPVSIIF